MKLLVHIFIRCYCCCFCHSPTWKRCKSNSSRRAEQTNGILYNVLRIPSDEKWTGWTQKLIHTEACVNRANWESFRVEWICVKTTESPFSFIKWIFYQSDKKNAENLHWTWTQWRHGWVQGKMQKKNKGKNVDILSVLYFAVRVLYE